MVQPSPVEEVALKWKGKENPVTTTEKESERLRSLKNSSQVFHYELYIHKKKRNLNSINSKGSFSKC